MGDGGEGGEIGGRGGSGMYVERDGWVGSFLYMPYTVRVYSLGVLPS